MSKKSPADQHSRRENRGAFTPDTAREAVRRRWQSDPQGIAAAVRKIVARAPALTPEQRELIRAALTAPTRVDER